MSGRSLLLAALLGFGISSVSAQEAQQQGLRREPLAGQIVAVLPITHFLRDTSVRDSGAPAGRVQFLAWADSVIAEALMGLAPEISWKTPDELRRAARRGAGVVPDPDRMGQAIMRARQITTVPDPLRSNLRTLMAVAGGRYAFIPASVSLTTDEEGAVRATLVVVLADARQGRVLWRTEAVAAGANVADAVRAAVQTFLPDPTASP